MDDIKTKQILVTGDFFYHCDLYSNGSNGKLACTKHTPGGALFIRTLLESVQSLTNNSFSTVSHNPEPLTAFKAPLSPYSLWEPQPTSGTDKIPVWRRSKKLGSGKPDIAIPQGTPLPESAPHVMVIDDHGFQSRYCNSLFPWEQPPQWIVLRQVETFCRGNLWCSLEENAAYLDNLVLVVSIRHLRKHDVRINSSLSWESIVVDLTRELQHNPEMEGLRKARHVIVSINCEGCLWMERSSNGFRFQLIFDPKCTENEWAEQQKIFGETHSNMSCFTAAIAVALTLSEACSTNTFTEALYRGLMAQRKLLCFGHGYIETASSPTAPFSEIAELITGNLITTDFKATSIPSNIHSHSNTNNLWRILENQALHRKTDPTSPLFGIAKQVALFGADSVLDAPIGIFGKLMTADRTEIESFRLLKQLFEDYLTDIKTTKPLAVAVFGPPGAGKSFGIKELGKSILGKDTPVLEFNLSQFRDSDDLIGALHQVRDKVLAGHCPMVFWDEFDSNSYKWLQYFLAPIQDGKFQEGQITHPTGRSIFVFAGATSYTIEDFGPTCNNVEAFREFKLLKGPDFISRISGHLNILGPNPITASAGLSDSSSSGETAFSDICYPVRRAIILRVILGFTGKRANEVMDIDRGLLSALLEVKHYTYATRSMERVLQSISSHGVSGMFRRSDLPADTILSSNLDLDDFKCILSREDQFQRKAEELAPHIHAVYRHLSLKEGWGFSYNMDYKDLPQEIKSDNVAAATRIPRILELVDLFLIPEKERIKENRENITTILRNHIELLAEHEHNLWAEHKKNNGWTYDKVRNENCKQHNCLIPYELLSDEDKKKDRNSVLNFPAIATHAGYKITQRR